MKKLLIALMMMATIPFMVSAQTAVTATTTTSATVVLPDPGLVPGDFFYFFKRFTEALDSLITFNAASKAKLALEHAQERAAELNVVLGTKGTNSKEAKRAKDDFDADVSLAANIVAEQKAKGEDVSGLAKEVDSGFEVSKDMIKEAYRRHHEELKGDDNNLHVKLDAAIKAGDVSAQAEIRAKLKSVMEETSAVLDETGSVDSKFDSEKNNLDEAMGAEQSAKSHIANAVRARANFVHELSVLGTATTTTAVDALTSFDALMVKATTAMTAGDFEMAKGYAKDAKDALHEARQNLETKDAEKNFFGGEKGGKVEMSETVKAPETPEQPEKKDRHEGEKSSTDASVNVEINGGTSDQHGN